MEHMLQLRVEHQSSTKLCSRDVARFMRSADASLVTLAVVAIASVALLLSSFPMGSSLSALLVAAGGVFMSKTALFVLSNAIFLLLAADCRCCFTATASAGDVASSESGGVMEKQQARHHHQVQVEVEVEVEQCAVQPCSGSLDRSKQEGEDRAAISASTSTDEEQDDVPVLSILELVRLDEEQHSIALEAVDVREPSCKTAKELDRLEIDELNKKFDEFIQSRRTEWIKEEEAAYLLL